MVLGYDSYDEKSNSPFAKDHQLDEFLISMKRIIDFFDFNGLGLLYYMKEKVMDVYIRLNHYLFDIKCVDFKKFYSYSLLDLNDLLIDMCKYEKMNELIRQYDKVDFSELNNLKEHEILDENSIEVLNCLSYLYIDIKKYDQDDIELPDDDSMNTIMLIKGSD